MQAKFLTWILCMVVVAQVGCVTKQRMTDSELRDDQLVIIQVVSKVGSGVGERISKVLYVDGEKVRPSSDYLVVEPGHHTISFHFEEILEVGGGLNVTVDIMGDARKVSESRNRISASPASSIRVRGDLSAGKTYFVDITTLSFKSTLPAEMEKVLRENSLYDVFPERFRLTGSASIKEKRNR